ncbi:16S rRNA (adenine(1518)-N(6)/adenine(1519)-N(6)) -dimethyltransferase RsmA [Polynucleobacter sp. HIN9]|uniref:16S rRNA (adenine(1518)-N(6)/adenine(1519)-N(6))- dimethyltransferase RsmA n=1 Tax=Polynucleobacter sp. HIN9 TaxID=3047868 RepID=UPI0025730E65|nr:16S rRNA (adenine(1518)-N(6)/adenine(1519)-N(6))-dimethyltransferase RsmA [Polynucleobacter sp. HIN9]BEI41663.1 16S rRNA (adenine(1518)-N(6)/adenine(1519)-N(6)) -dimethyltransferase RsmA [Polynucleobacter sp. HIN9]
MHRARKRFGQNFLIDQGVIAAIVNALNPTPGMHVLEIGPGLGALTRPLLERLEKLEVLEIDRDIVYTWEEAKLRERLDGLIIHEGDALQFDFVSWAKQAKVSKERCALIGNLPYNISSPLLFHLIAAAPWVDEQVFMLQAEVVERITASAGDSEYSRLSVMLQARYHVDYLLDVPPTAFEPQPKVDSAVIQMIPRADFALTPAQWDALSQIVALAFAQRRKMLRSNLQSIAEQLNLTDTELKARAQDISVERYIQWALMLSGK